MNIGTTAKLSGVSAKTIRYYEDVGLLRPASRTPSGYRQYADADVQILRFVDRARSLGFSVEDVGKLLGLWADKRRKSAQVKSLANRHIEDIERKIRELDTMRTALLDLARRCHGDERPECPILDELADAHSIAIRKKPCWKPAVSGR